jgi:hypothetical protein
LARPAWRVRIDTRKRCLWVSSFVHPFPPAEPVKGCAVAVFVVVYDAKGQLVGIERQDDVTFGQKLKTIRDTQLTLERPLTFQAPFDPQLFQFHGIAEDIRESGRLTPQQRDVVFGVFNSFRPGDKFALATLPPLVAQVADGQPKMRSVIAVFVDP